ncbi:MAG: zincin-like metallopeptidase domain-containing protein [Pacificimonas sp.]
MPRKFTSPAATITAAIIERLEAGTAPWVKPWKTGQGGFSRPLRANGVPYRGMNTFWLWMVADAKGFGSPSWMTYRQAAELGGQVRKSEKSTIAIFYKTYEKEVETPRGEPDTETRRVLRSYSVFNADQIDGLPERYRPALAEIPIADPGGRRADLDAFFGCIPVPVRQHGDRAYYEPAADRITMPPPSLFDDYEHYYATLAHECAHATGHGSRLDRNLKGRFGDQAYAAEELIAEMTAAMLGAEVGLPTRHLDHHASYIASWLKLLRKDDRAILTAAAKAEAASDWLLGSGRGSLVGSPVAIAAA